MTWNLIYSTDSPNKTVSPRSRNKILGSSLHLGLQVSSHTTVFFLSKNLGLCANINPILYWCTNTKDCWHPSQLPRCKLAYLYSSGNPIPTPLSLSLFLSLSGPSHSRTLVTLLKALLMPFSLSCSQRKFARQSSTATIGEKCADEGKTKHLIRQTVTIIQLNRKF